MPASIRGLLCVSFFLFSGVDPGIVAMFVVSILVSFAGYLLVSKGGVPERCEVISLTPWLRAILVRVKKM